ncbi:MAG: phosphotransferase [Halioglobus sp.]
MSKPLSENPRHLEQLCAALDIGPQIGALSGVSGGYHHRMWRLESQRGSYAVKQLSVDADVSDADTVEHYNVTETIAETFAGRGVPAVYAIKQGETYLQVIDGEGYLVYPWSAGAALDIFQISTGHALEIARILARMHRANIAVPGANQQQFDIHGEEKIVQLLELSWEFNRKVAKSLQDALPNVLSVVERQRSATQSLQCHQVISHGDLDQKNVLWDTKGNPALIDWESARELNPTYEIVLEALNWSGIGSRFDPQLFWKLISSYRNAGGIIERDSLEASFHCVLGDWVNWLMYNVGRSFDPEDEAQRTLGAQQVDLALSTLRRLSKELPELVSRERL